MHLKMSSVKWRPFCLILNVLKKKSQSYGKHNKGLSIGELACSHGI